MVLQETAANLYDELNSLSDEELVTIAQQVDSDRLREHLETLSDDELIEAGIETGVLTEELDEADDDEEVTVQDLLDYVEHLEGQLQEAEEIVGELVGRLEESGDADTALLKYEAALEIIQETVGRFQLLQEAVGGEDRANQLMESYVAKLEAENDTESNDINVVEGVLNEDGSAGNKMSEYLRLTEGALTRLGAR
jgi:phosphomevalonate kinase